MLFAMRTRCVKGIKSNFKGMKNTCQHCPMKCSEDTPVVDSQEHVLQCSALGGSDTDMDFIHASPVEQSHLVKTFCKLMKRREQLLEGKETSRCCSLPGVILDQCTPQGAAVVHHVWLFWTNIYCSKVQYLLGISQHGHSGVPQLRPLFWWPANLT